MGIARTCPRCGSVDTHRSHRKHVEYLLPMLRPFRCGRCDRRFFSKLTANERETARVTGK